MITDCFQGQSQLRSNCWNPSATKMACIQNNPSPFTQQVIGIYCSKFLVYLLSAEGWGPEQASLLGFYGLSMQCSWLLGIQDQWELQGEARESSQAWACRGGPGTQNERCASGKCLSASWLSLASRCCCCCHGLAVRQPWKPNPSLDPHSEAWGLRIPLLLGGAPSEQKKRGPLFLHQTQIVF